MTDDEDLENFMNIMQQTLCSDYLDFMEMIDGIGFYIPFITTMNYLSHSETRKILKLKDLTKLQN